MWHIIPKHKQNINFTQLFKESTLNNKVTNFDKQQIIFKDLCAIPLFSKIDDLESFNGYINNKLYRQGIFIYQNHIDKKNHVMQDYGIILKNGKIINTAWTDVIANHSSTSVLRLENQIQYPKIKHSLTLHNDNFSENEKEWLKWWLERKNVCVLKNWIVLLPNLSDWDFDIFSPLIYKTITTAFTIKIVSKHLQKDKILSITKAEDIDWLTSYSYEDILLENQNRYLYDILLVDISKALIPFFNNTSLSTLYEKQDLGDDWKDCDYNQSWHFSKQYINDLHEHFKHLLDLSTINNRKKTCYLTLKDFHLSGNKIYFDFSALLHYTHLRTLKHKETWNEFKYSLLQVNYNFTDTNNTLPIIIGKKILIEYDTQTKKITSTNEYDKLLIFPNNMVIQKHFYQSKNEYFVHNFTLTDSLEKSIKEQTTLVDWLYSNWDIFLTLEDTDYFNFWNIIKTYLLNTKTNNSLEIQLCKDGVLNYHINPWSSYTLYKSLLPNVVFNWVMKGKKKDQNDIHAEQTMFYKITGRYVSPKNAMDVINYKLIMPSLLNWNISNAFYMNHQEHIFLNKEAYEKNIRTNLLLGQDYQSPYLTWLFFPSHTKYATISQNSRKKSIEENIMNIKGKKWITYKSFF